MVASRSARITGWVVRQQHDRGTEALREPLVLQLDDPHVPDCLQAARCPEPDPAEVPAVPVPGPGRPAVLAHAARSSRNTAAATHCRLLAMPVSR
jgi:hypothetical protein